MSKINKSAKLFLNKLVSAPVRLAIKGFGFKRVERSTKRPLQLINHTGNLNIEKLIAHLEAEGLSGVVEYFSPNLEPVISIPEAQRQQCIEAILEFCAKENTDFGYRRKKVTLTPASVKVALQKLADKKSISINCTSLDSLDELRFCLAFWEECDEYYMLAARSAISRKLWKSTAEQAGLFQAGSFKNYSTILKYTPSLERNFDIDLVFTWVNGDDPDWLKMYHEYRPETRTDGSSKSRFHSRDELKYALRSWEKHAPFIRRIFIVSNCAPPPWLNLENDKVRWVYHEEILPAEVLPTFSSHAIETSLHNIEGISNYFIYSNDDFLLTRLANSDNFFHSNGIAKVRLEPYGMVNGVSEAGHPDYLNGARNSNALIESAFHRSATQLVTHSPQPLRKDIMVEMEGRFPVEFQTTKQNKFRKVDDIAVTGYLHAHYAILSGKALADKTQVLLIQQNHNFKSKFKRLQRYKAKKPGRLPLSVCLNDGNDSHLNDAWNESVSEFLDAFFPNSSSMEKDTLSPDKIGEDNRST